LHIEGKEKWRLASCLRQRVNVLSLASVHIHIMK
jgi:hypothetical protein